MTELSGMTASEAIAASDGVRARSGAAASRRAQEHPQSPEELDRAAWHDVRLIACAILAEREASEKRMGELLKDPRCCPGQFSSRIDCVSATDR